MSDQAGHDPLLGRVVGGKFALRRMIGAGSSGAVYQADQIALGRTVAVKILRPDLAVDPRFVRRFHDEALAASRLNHPNVVSVIDYGQTEDGLLYLVMEYLRGSTLTHVLHHEALTTAQIADIVAQILAGLEEAHEAGVVHADLKADNVVVERRRSDWALVKVVDFGIARLAGTPSGEGDTIAGTPEYMAPEVISGLQPTFASDLYAVGVVLYELLTGVTPFAGGATMQVLRAHVNDTPVRPSARRPDRAIDRRLEDLALRALTKEPAQRFPSTAAFRAAVRAIAEPAGEADAVVCEACGVGSPVAFKFCPECGHPRGGTAVGPSPARAPTPVPDLGLADGDRAETEDLPFDAAAFALDGAAREARRAAVVPLPLVGRAAELEAVVGFLESGPGALEVVGPVGSGRSRLVDEALHVMAGRLDRVVVVGADPSGHARSGWPIRHAVAGLLALDDDGRMIAADALAERAAAAGLDDRDVPALLALLGRDGPLRQLDPAVGRREAIATLLRLVRGAATRRSTVLVFDDVDRFDEPSREMVRRIAELASGGDGPRVVVIGGLDEARLAGPTDRVSLAPLDRAALTELAGFLAAAGMPGMPGADELAAACRGLPSHIHQLVRYAIEDGDAATAPANLADLIAARLALLPQGARVVCQAVAVLGARAGRDVLDAMLGDDGEVRAAMAVAQARGILAPDDGGVRFDEQLLREVTYAATPADVRRALHREALAALAGQDDAVVLGHHHRAAGEREQAATLLARAGDEARRELDEAAARRHYTDALAAARESMLEGAELAARRSFADVSGRLAEVLIASGARDLARGVLGEAEFHGGDDPATHARLGRMRAALHDAEGDAARAIAVLREAIGGAIVLGKRELLCELYLDLATHLVRAGQLRDAVRELAEAVDLVTLGEGEGGSGGPEMLWRVCFRVGQLVLATGDLEGAVAWHEAAARHAERAGARGGLARVHAALAGLLDRTDQRALAAGLRAQAIEELRRLGDRRGTAELLLEAGQLLRAGSPEALAMLEEARALAKEIGWSEGSSRARRASTAPDPR